MSDRKSGVSPAIFHLEKRAWTSCCRSVASISTCVGPSWALIQSFVETFFIFLQRFCIKFIQCFVESFLFLIKDSTCFAFGGRPRTFGLEKNIASPVLSSTPSAGILAFGGLPLLLGLLDKDKVGSSPFSSKDETTLICSSRSSAGKLDS